MCFDGLQIGGICRIKKSGGLNTHTPPDNTSYMKSLLFLFIHAAHSSLPINSTPYGGSLNSIMIASSKRLINSLSDSAVVVFDEMNMPPGPCINAGLYFSLKNSCISLVSRAALQVSPSITLKKCPAHSRICCNTWPK